MTDCSLPINDSPIVLTGPSFNLESEGIKRCAKCLEFKTLNNFSKDNGRKGGRYPNCRLCEKIRGAAKYANPAYREKLLLRGKIWREANRPWKKAYIRQWRHGVVPSRPEPFHCEICGSLPGPKGMNLDHCHKQKIFRGWLCTNCNCAIGFAKDNPALLRKLADYVESAT